MHLEAPQLNERGWKTCCHLEEYQVVPFHREVVTRPWNDSVEGQYMFVYHL